MLKSKIYSWTIVFASIFLATSAFAQKDLVISGGNTVSSFVCENKTAFVWGSNTGGQLGLSPNPGATVSIPAPVTVYSGVASPPDIKQINSGSGSHFVALACTGDVWAWGVNGSGQIGIGSAGGVVAIPRRVIANAAVDALYRGAGNVLQNAAVVYSGTVNSFAILQNGDLVSWGGNSGTEQDATKGLPAQEGQLGQGTNTDVYTANYVLTGPGTRLKNVVQIFAGDNVAYALVDPEKDGIGTVYSWGFGLNGTLGRNAAGNGNPSSNALVQSSYAQPVHYGNGTPMNNIQQLQAGDVFGIALDVNNYVWTWGNGYWNNSTGNAPANTTSEPRRVIAGNTIGASNDGTYLLAKAIGGGQGYGMAVTIDGKPVAWGGGGCSNGGTTGNGTLTGNTKLTTDPNTTDQVGPEYIMYGAGLVHDNVTLINRGDTWGFYGTSDNELYAWGCNAYGQLGIGNTTSQAYATKITPPTGCDFRDPAPYANIDKSDMPICPGAVIILNSGFAPPLINNNKYEVRWYRNNTQVQIGTADDPNKLLYSVTQAGTYRVEIEYKGTNAGCLTYDIAIDDVIISDAVTPFTAVAGKYCGSSGTFSVLGYTGNLTGYQWYKDATGGSPLAITPATTPPNTSNTITTALTNATAVNATTYRLWAADVFAAQGTAIPTAPVCTPSSVGANEIAQKFTIAANSTLNSIDFFVASYSSGVDNYSVQILNDNAGNVGGTVVWTSPVASLTRGANGTFLPRTLPVNFTTTTGGTYWLKIVSAQPVGSLNCFSYPSVDNSGKSILSITDGDLNYSKGNRGAAYNWKVTRGIISCARIPVDIVEDCPPCSKPTTVTITNPATTPFAICEGSPLVIKGSATVPAATQNGGFTYSWRKVLPLPVTVPVAPTAMTFVPATAKAVPDYVGPTAVTAADAGTYVLRVEDGNTGVATCYTEATVVITVNPRPTISSAATGTVCSEVAQNYTITSAVASSYAWTRAVVSGITPATIGSGTTASITETLTNTTTAPIVVRYVITPTSTAGSCPGPAFNYDVTVNPKPKITSAITGSVCSGIAQAYTITSDVASSYAWTRAVVANITPATVGSGSTAAITETLTNTLTPAGPVNVIYKLTPTATTGGCVGTTADYTVTVNPSPTITSAATRSICSGIAPSYTIASSIPASYAWTRAVVTGITPATAGSGTTASIAETLTNTTTAPINVEYKIRGTATTGGCVGPEFTYTLTVNPTPVVAATTASICSGVAQNHAITSVVPSSYAWSRPVVTGITPATAGAGTTTPITETLTNNTTAPIAVVYSITPTSTTGSCVGAASTYTVTVNPKPTITSSATGTTCTNVALNYLITSDVASTYSWTRAAVTGVSPAPGAASSANPITETLASSSDVDVVYTITPTSTAGSCPGPAFTYTVRISATAKPTVAITTTPGTTICANTPVTFTTTVTSGGTPTYEWFVNNVSQGGASAAAGSEQFSSSTLTNGAVVKVEITSSLGCAVPKEADASVTMTVNPNVTASVTVAADKTDICPNESVTFTATPVNGGTTPAPTYVWKDKAGAVISGPTGTTYTTTGLTAANNSVTVEMTSTANCATPKPAISPAASVTVKTVPAPSVTVLADKMAVCEGNPVVFTATPVAGGAAPSYEWFIGTESQGASSSAAGSEIFTTSGLTVSTASPGNTVTVKMISNADCAPTAAATSPVVTIAVSPGVKPGTLSADQVICYETAADKITELTASDAVTATYTWQQTTDPSDELNWGPAAGTPSNGGKDFTPSAVLTSDMYYRRRVDDAAAPAPCDKAYTTPVKITVNADVTAGVIASTGGATCTNDPTTAISSTSLPTGGSTTSTPAFTYVWESMTVANPIFGPASGANTGETYNPGNLSVTTTYRRREVNSCKTVYSNVIEKTVTPKTPVSVDLSDPGQSCAGTEITLTAAPTGGGGSPVYKWFNKGGVVSGVTGNTYKFTPAAGADNSNTVIRVELTSSDVCNTGVADSELTLDIIEAVAPKIEIVGTTVNCEGFPSTFRVSSEIGQGPNPRYDWYVGGIVVQSGPDKTFKTSGLLDGEKVYVELISDLPCKIGSGPFISTDITVQIKPIPSPVINEPGDTICSPATYPMSAQVRIPAYTGTTYQWMRDGKAISGATTDKYTASESGVYAISEYNGTCNNTSPGTRVVVVQTPVAYAGEDMYIKEGDRGQLFGSGGAIYNWTPSTGLSDPKISNPTFTAEQTTLYTLTVSDPTGKCKTPDEVIVYVVRPIKIPNVITINGDGTNDTWEIENIESYPNAEFLIYNRWGNLVWKQEGNAKKWDGTNFRNGEVLPDGTYFYIITLNSQIYNEPYTGWIQIVK